MICGFFLKGDSEENRKPQLRGLTMDYRKQSRKVCVRVVCYDACGSLMMQAVNLSPGKG